MLMDFLKGKWLGHPLHPILVHLPLGLWPAALVFDLLARVGVGGNAMVQVSFFAIALGLLAAFLAAPTGIADWTGIKKGKPAWKLGLYHMALSLVVTLIFAINLGLRFEDFREATAVGNAPLLLSLAGTILLIVSGYLGGAMVYRHGVSVARLSKDKWRKAAERGGANLPETKEDSR